jgi:hypothetical protein
MAYVYLHIRASDESVFYVGIGKNETRGFIRAFELCNRNRFWNNIYKKHGRKVRITHTDVIWEEACAIERYLIAFYGRADKKTGILCNLTDGGDGASGAVRSPEHLAIIKNNYNNNLRGRINNAEQLSRIAAANRGKKASESTRAKMSLSGKNRSFSKTHRQNLSLASKGKPKKPEAVRRQAEALRGKFPNGKNPNAKKVLDTSTGEVFSCIKEASERYKIHPSRLTCILNGKILNKTSLIKLEK